MDVELAEHAQHWVNVVLIWVGFGTLAGLLAKVILPMQRTTAGPMLTLLLGVGGSVIGLFLLSTFLGTDQLNPISPLGFVAAAASAFCLLLLYRLACACLPAQKKDANPS